MEKQLLNAGWRLAAIALLLWLAGCASRSPIDTRSQTPLPPVTVAPLESSGVAQLMATSDLWERIRRGFAMPTLSTPEVQQQLGTYLDHPESIARMATRSRRYLFHIVEQLELRDMPTEIALLPFVESAYNPQAQSHARAVGLWQFIPSTGRYFDLQQNALRDDRRSVVDSTRAALDFLQQLHERFGDWHLALAAYNWGPGNVERAIQRNLDQGLGTRYADLSMPAETRNYIPKLQALKEIVAQPAAFAIALPAIGNHPFFDSVSITQDLDIATAASLAGISEDDFRALNPAHRKPVILASATPQVLLPWDNAATFRANLAATPPEALPRWTLWTATNNLRAAQVAQRFGMSEARFRQLNGVPGRGWVRKGSTVVVARSAAPDTAAAARAAGATQPATTPAGASQLRRIAVQARAGDTTATLAARYDLPAATVAGWNQVRPGTRLARGRHMTLYLPADAAQAVAASDPAARVAGITQPTATQGKVAVQPPIGPARTHDGATGTRSAKARVHRTLK